MPHNSLKIFMFKALCEIIQKTQKIVFFENRDLALVFIKI